MDLLICVPIMDQCLYKGIFPSIKGKIHYCNPNYKSINSKSPLLALEYGEQEEPRILRTQYQEVPRCASHCRGISGAGDE